MADQKAITTGDLSDSNFPMDGEGRVYHVGLKYGEVANRIMIMGCPDRAKLIVTLLDGGQAGFSRITTRGFSTYTGRYKNIPITIAAIGMGPSMVDFFYREIRAITKGPLAIIRLGSCGTPRADIPVGSICVSESSRLCYLNPEAFIKGLPEKDRYVITAPLTGDDSLTNQLEKDLVKAFDQKEHKVVRASDITTDSFYSGQGRIDKNFDDQNTGLVDNVSTNHPDVGSFQMETYTMYFLSKICKLSTIHSSACGIVLAQRQSGAFLTHEVKHKLEKQTGAAILETLIHYWGTDQKDLMDGDETCVWNKK